MKVLPQDISDQLDASTSQPIFLYDISVPISISASGWLYFTSYNKDVYFTYAGITYTAMAIQHSNTQIGTLGQVDNLTITVGNADRNFSSYCADSSEQVGLAQQTVIVRLAFAGFLVEEALLIFAGHIKKATFPNATECQLTAASILDLEFIKIPQRRYNRNFCAWEFKDPFTCRYLGSEASCNKTLKMCEKFGNLINFGGFPGVPDAPTLVI